MQPDLFTPRYPDVPGSARDAAGSLRSAPISHGNGSFDQ